MKEKDLIAQGKDILKDRPLEGINFAQALDEKRAQDPNFDPERRLNVPITEDYFKEMFPLRISPDGLHVIGVGYDEGRSVLIRDGKPVFSQVGGAINIMDGSEDFSRLLIVSEKGYRQLSILYIEGEQINDLGLDCYRDIKVVNTSPNLDNFLICGMKDHRTDFEPYRQGPKGIEQNSGFSLAKGFSWVDIVDFTSDYGRIVWQGARRGKQFVYHDDIELCKAEYIDTLSANAKPLRYLLVTRNKDSYEVNVDGRVYLKEKDLRTGRVHKNSDMTLAMLPLDRHDGTKQLFVLTPKGVALSKPYGKLSEVEVGEDKLVAGITRDGVQREIVITKDGETREGEPSEASDVSPSPADYIENAGTYA